MLSTRAWHIYVLEELNVIIMEAKPRTLGFPLPLRARLPLAFLPCLRIRRQIISTNLIKMTHGLACMLQSLILFTVLGERAIITGAGTECF